MKLKYRLEEWDGDTLLFQVLEQEGFFDKKYRTSKGFDIISHKQVSITLGGKRAYLRNNIKEYDFNICILYFENNDKLQEYKIKLIEALEELQKEN
jgi:hypothetical protein